MQMQTVSFAAFFPFLYKLQFFFLTNSLKKNWMQKGCIEYNSRLFSERNLYLLHFFPPLHLLQFVYMARM